MKNLVSGHVWQDRCSVNFKRKLAISPPDEALYNFLSLPIVAKSSILKVLEFLDLPLKTLPYLKTSPVSCENQSFFLLFQNVATFIESHCIFLYFFLQYEKVFSISLLDGYYHYLVFMDPVNGFSKSELLVKEQVSLKSKIRFGSVCMPLVIFIVPVFYFDQSSAHLLMLMFG